MKESWRLARCSVRIQSSVPESIPPGGTTGNGNAPVGSRTEAGAACCEPLIQGARHSWASRALPVDPVLGSLTTEKGLKAIKGVTSWHSAPAFSKEVWKSPERCFGADQRRGGSWASRGHVYLTSISDPAVLGQSENRVGVGAPT